MLNRSCCRAQVARHSRISAPERHRKAPHFLGERRPGSGPIAAMHTADNSRSHRDQRSSQTPAAVTEREYKAGGLFVGLRFLVARLTFDASSFSTPKQWQWETGDARSTEPRSREGIDNSDVHQSTPVAHVDRNVSRPSASDLLRWSSE